MNGKRKTLFSIVSIIIIAISFSGCIVYSPQVVYLKHADRTEWAFVVTQINKLNDLGFYGSNVTIGIIDTGIDVNHSDLQHVRVVWKDYINNKNTPYDDNGHGTHVAGILSSSGEMNGIAPKAKLIVVKALDKDGMGSDNIVAKAIYFCADPDQDGNMSDGADIITLSIGGFDWPFISDFMGDASNKACEYAVEKGIMIVVAAGNNGPYNGDVSPPATVPSTIAVGAIDCDKKIAEWSSRGDNNGLPFLSFDNRYDPNKKPEVVAPGVGIISTYKDGFYLNLSGTSIAAPFVTGIIALLLEGHPQYKHKDSGAVEQLKTVLMDTAEKLNEQEKPHDRYYGYGLIQGYDAFLAIGGDQYSSV